MFLIGVYWVSKACNGRGRVRQESIQKTWKCSLLRYTYSAGVLTDPKTHVQSDT